MISYRQAVYSDNLQLLELTAATGMQGDISLRIDRQPDFFRLLHQRGETKVFVALDDEKIIGSLSVSRQWVYVGGEVMPLQYIGDFKVSEPYRNKGIGLQLCNVMADEVIASGSDLAFLNVSKGNQKPLSFFKNRPQVPDFENIGLFHIYQFAGRRKKSFFANYEIRKTDCTDEVIHFLNERYCQYELGTVITRQNTLHTDIFILEQAGAVKGVMCLTDMMSCKQNIVMKLSPATSTLLTTLNALKNILGISRMPMLREPVKMLYIKWLAVTNHEQRSARLLLDYARNLVYEKSYSFVSIGIHEKDPLTRCFAGIFKMTFKSVGMLLSIKGNKQLIEKVHGGIPYEDYSLV